MSYRLLISRSWTVGMIGISLTLAGPLSAQVTADSRPVDRQQESDPVDVADADDDNDDARRDDDADEEEGLTEQIQREILERVQQFLEDRDRPRTRGRRDRPSRVDRPGRGPQDRPRAAEADSEADRPDEERAFHLDQAIEHLRALGWNDEADRLRRRWEFEGRRPPVVGRPFEGPRGFGPGPRGFDEDRMGSMRRMLENSQRRVDELRRRIESRAANIERELDQRFRAFERRAEQRFDELEEYVRMLAERWERDAITRGQDESIREDEGQRDDEESERLDDEYDDESAQDDDAADDDFVEQDAEDE